MLTLQKTLNDVIEQLHSHGGELPAPLAVRASEVGLTVKGRDPREPGLRKKNRMEKRLRQLIARRFKRQIDELRKHLEAMNPNRKALSAGGVIVNTDDIDAELILLFVEAIREGVDIFDALVPLDVDYAAANNRALDYARTYVTEWLSGLDATSAEAVRNAVQHFVDTPGSTVGDAINLLTTTFGDDRAERIAITEITRAYAEGNQLAGEDLAAQWPGVRVTKRWFTNNDDLVCPICGPLEGAEVNIDEEFAPGIDNPPAHVNCRCWTSVGTV